MLGQKYQGALLLATLTLVTNPAAADIAVGPESALSTPDFWQRRFNQRQPSIATNGTDLLIADSSQTGIATQRISGTGTYIDQVPQTAGRGQNPCVIPYGTDYIVAWTNAGVLLAQEIRADGTETPGPYNLLTGGLGLSFRCGQGLAVNDTLLLVGTNSSLGYSGHLFDWATLSDLGPISIGGLLPSASATATEFVLADTLGVNTVRVRRLDSTGATTSSTQIDVSVEPKWLGLSSSANRDVVAWTGPEDGLFVMDLSNPVPTMPLAADVLVPNETSQSPRRPRLASLADGRVVLAHVQGDTPTLSRIDVPAQQILSEPITTAESSDPAVPISITATNNTAIVAVLEQGAIGGKNTSAFISTGIGKPNSLLLSRQARGQYYYSAARVVEGTFVSWNEARDYFYDGAELGDFDAVDPTQIQIARLDDSGVTTELLGVGHGSALATNGLTVAAFWAARGPFIGLGIPDEHDLHVATFDASGNRLSDEDLLSSIHVSGILSAAFDGNEWLVATREFFHCITPGACPYNPVVLRFDQNFTLLDEYIIDSPGVGATVSIVAGGPGQALVLWDDGVQSTFETQFLLGSVREGNKFNPPFRLDAALTPQRQASAIWNGSSWIATWIGEQGGFTRVMVARIEQDGTVSTPIHATTQTVPAWPSVAETFDGHTLMLTWSGSVAGGPAQIYGQLIDRDTLAPIPNTTAVVLDDGPVARATILGGTDTPGSEGVLVYQRRPKELDNDRVFARTIVGPRFDGEGCDENLDCGSQQCVDGICCATACLPCERCELTAAGASCATVTGQSDDECFGDQSCSATGECLSANGQTCNDDMECASSECVGGGLCCDRACDGPCETCSGDGVCQVLSCGGYQCAANDVGEKTCLSSCESTADCASGHQCNAGGLCVAIADPNAGDDSGCGCRTAPQADQRGSSSSQLPWWVGGATAALIWRRRRRRVAGAVLG